MPRNSSGDYSLLAGSLVSTGDTLLVSQHNPPFQDIANSISSSLDRDGRGGMRANLTMNGNKVTGIGEATDPSDAVALSQLSAITGVPIGACIDYFGTTPPSGYLFAAGQEISRATYASLFAVLGTTYGSGDGSTTFNLPDTRGRVSAGREDMATPATTRLNNFSSSTLGAGFGSQSHTLTSAQMPTHTHTVADPGHTHSYNGATGAVAADGVTTVARVGAGQTTGSSTTGITIGNAGSGNAHNNTQPTLITNKIIKVS